MVIDALLRQDWSLIWYEQNYHFINYAEKLLYVIQVINCI